MIALSPDPQTRLIVVALVESGRPGLQCCLAGRRLAGAGLEHLTHEHVVDLDGGRVETGSLDGRTDGDAAQRRRRHAAQPAAELADRACGPRSR